MLNNYNYHFSYIRRANIFAYLLGITFSYIRRAKIETSLASGHFGTRTGLNRGPKINLIPSHGAEEAKPPRTQHPWLSQIPPVLFDPKISHPLLPICVAPKDRHAACGHMTPHHTAKPIGQEQA